MDEFAPELEPAEAAAIFGAQLDQARGYFKALVRDSDLLGLLGSRIGDSRANGGRCGFWGWIAWNPNGFGSA